MVEMLPLAISFSNINLIERLFEGLRKSDSPGFDVSLRLAFEVLMNTSNYEPASMIKGYFVNSFTGPSLKTLCKMAVVHHKLDQSCLPWDIRYDWSVWSHNCLLFIYYTTIYHHHHHQNIIIVTVIIIIISITIIRSLSSSAAADHHRHHQIVINNNIVILDIIDITIIIIIVVIIIILRNSNPI